jgi:fluoroacetyl-CoA thioesterase
MRPLTAGLSATFIHRVQLTDLAQAWGNPFPVLATPILLWLSEIAAMKAVEECLNEDQITLGLAHNSKHLGASFEGADIEISARLTAWTDKTLEFEVQAHDRARLVLSGTHTRAVLPHQRFCEKLDKLRAETL